MCYFRQQHLVMIQFPGPFQGSLLKSSPTEYFFPTILTPWMCHFKFGEVKLVALPWLFCNQQQQSFRAGKKCVMYCLRLRKWHPLTLYPFSFIHGKSIFTFPRGFPPSFQCRRMWYSLCLPPVFIIADICHFYFCWMLYLILFSKICLKNVAICRF